MGSATTLRIVSHSLEFEIRPTKRLVGLLVLPMFCGGDSPSLDVVENPAVEHLKPGQDPTPLPPDLLLHKLAENEVALVETLLGHVMPVDKQVGGAGGGGGLRRRPSCPVSLKVVQSH